MRQETSCCADRSDIGRWRSSTCCVILDRATVVGRGRDWAVRARLAVCRTIMGCADYVAPSRVKLERSAFNVF